MLIGIGFLFFILAAPGRGATAILVLLLIGLAFLGFGLSPFVTTSLQRNTRVYVCTNGLVYVKDGNNNVIR